MSSDLDKQGSPPFELEYIGPTLGFNKNYNLTATVANLIPTFASVPSTTIPTGTTWFQTAGFNTPGDGGRAIYTPVASNPGIGAGGVQSADGQWWRIQVQNGQVNIEQFGGVADWNGSTGTDNSQPLKDALASVNVTIVAGVMAPKINFGIGQYYFASTIAPLNYIFWMQGAGAVAGGGGFNTGTRFHFPADTLGIQLDNENTTGTTTRAASGRGCQGTIIDSIGLEGSGTNTAMHGVRLRVTATLRNVFVHGFPGNGFEISATAGSGGNTEGNCNTWVMENCTAHAVGQHGLHVKGNDANAGTNLGFNTLSSVGGCGILDESGLGSNSHLGSQITGYGNTGVYNSGHIYQLIDQAPGLGGTTTPGTDNTIWYDRGTGSPSGQFPQWVLNNTYLPTSPVLSGTGGVFGTPNIFASLYIEGGGLAHVPAPGLIISGECVSTNYSSQLFTRSATAGPTYMQMGTGGAFTFAAGTTGNTNNGASTFANMGSSVDGDRTANSGINVLSHFRAADGDTYNYGYNTGITPDLRYWAGPGSGIKPIWEITTAITTQNFGRSAVVKYMPQFFDLALRDPGSSSNNRIIGMRPSSPQTYEASTPHAQGEFYFNVSPTVDGSGNILAGWVCTSSGTPGTFTTCFFKSTSP
jgi:hypothetical protein